MRIACIRCGKEIDTPDSTNADYVIASDMVTKEPRAVVLAFKHNQATLDKQAKMTELNPDGSLKYPDMAIDIDEYDVVEVPSIEAAKALSEDLVKVVTEINERDVQKTGIICPECYRSTDFVIWGVHKSSELEKR